MPTATSCSRWIATAIALPLACAAPACTTQLIHSEAGATSGGGNGGGVTFDGGGGADGGGSEESTDAPSEADAPADVMPEAGEDATVDAPRDAPPDVASDGNPCTDNDHDGWTTCDGDCDDNNPLVNPGAYDFPNGIDDDCDGDIDDGMRDCGAGLAYSSQDPMDYARAIGLCQQTTVNPPMRQRVWGVLSAELRLSDGTGMPAAESHAIVTSFGDAMMPPHGPNMAYISTGVAATPTQPYFTSTTPQPGTQNLPGSFPLPPGFPTNKAGCATPANAAFDPVNLKLTIRVPTNAFSFAFDHAFFSAEYPEYACTHFNDMWVALLTTSATGIANNHNIIFDEAGTPGSVNLSFFDRCVAGPTGCAGGTPGFNFCAGGTGDLAGTGYDAPDNQCGVATTIGGGTGWMTTEAPVTPGETMVIELMVWDSSDGIYDSIAVFDNFRWQTKTLTNATTHR